MLNGDGILEAAEEREDLGVDKTHVFDFAGYTSRRNDIADIVGPIDQYHHAGGEIAECVLKCEADDEAEYTETCEQRTEGNAELRQGDHDAQCRQRREHRRTLARSVGLFSRRAHCVAPTAGKTLSNLVMQLRKVCLHPALFDDTYYDEDLETIMGHSGKLAVLDMLLRSLYEKGHRVVLFSQMVRCLDI